MSTIAMKAEADGAFPTPFSMAYQPIVDATTGGVFAYEALVRAPGGEGAASVLAHLTPGNRWTFDEACRTRALSLALELGLGAPGETALLSINFLPNAVADPGESVATTLWIAEAANLSPNRIIFEFTEHEPIDTAHLQGILKTYRALGFRTAIDDFGAGYAGLTLLSRFQPDEVKLDMALVRCLDIDRVKRTIVAHIVRMAADLGVQVIAEGIETVGEYEALIDLGVTLFQGYLFARPAFERLPRPAWPARCERPLRAA